MKPLTALGLDGMPLFFYKSYWNIVGSDVIDATLSVLNSGIMPPNINHTFITLIPKTKSPTSPKDFYPISLCNVMYKIISKTIANRLKKILPKLVLKTQSAFMSDRLITDNILIAFETLHHLKNKRKGKMEFMALKLDMSKAYDKVEWNFLEKIMERFDFDSKWRNLVSCCIHSVSFSIMVNGEPHGLFSPSRGLYQGYCLSPYLFLLCLSLIYFFADDSLLLYRDNDTDCQAVMDILTKYEQASSQKINRGKTQLFSNSNTDMKTKNKVKDQLGVEAVTQYEKYLELPSFVGRGKKESFSYIRERVWHKIQGWKEKLLSQAGHEILIKSVIQVMLTFTMGCFKLPKSLCRDIESLIRKFWWGYSGESRKIHWTAWKKLCSPKIHGGWGFKELENFNLALLGKQIWHLVHNKNSMLYKVVKARFFLHCSIFDSKVKTLSSYAW